MTPAVPPKISWVYCGGVGFWRAKSGPSSKGERYSQNFEGWYVYDAHGGPLEVVGAAAGERQVGQLSGYRFWYHRFVSAYVGSQRALVIGVNCIERRCFPFLSAEDAPRPECFMSALGPCFLPPHAVVAGDACTASCGGLVWGCSGVRRSGRIGCAWHGLDSRLASGACSVGCCRVGGWWWRWVCVRSCVLLGSAACGASCCGR